MLSIEALDKIRQTMDLLIKDNRMEWKGSLKETYFNTLHPDVLDYSKELWEPTWDNKVLDIFQQKHYHTLIYLFFPNYF